MVDEPKINDFKTDAGEMLYLKSVSAKVLREFVEELGGFDGIFERLNSSTSEIDEKISNRFLMYILGFGIANDLPEYANDELDLLGIKTKSKRVKMAHWVRSILTNAECSDVVSRVFLLSLE